MRSHDDKNRSATPRTDALEWAARDENGDLVDVVYASDCGQLERELAEAIAARDLAVAAARHPTTRPDDPQYERPTNYWCNDVAEIAIIEAALDFYETSARSATRECVGWIQELHDGRKCFYAGDLDPREVHDNGKPCYRVFK